MSGEANSNPMSGEDYESAKLTLENNRVTLIFWAVLVFTCVVAIVGLLPEITSMDSLSLPSTVYDTHLVCVGIIYFGLLGGMVFSMVRVYAIYEENRGLALSGRLGDTIKDQATERRTVIDKLIDSPHGRLVSRILILDIVLVFIALYLSKTWVATNPIIFQ